MKLAYIVKRFPRFSETFILNELLAIQAMGIEVDVYSLLKPGDEPQHGILDEFQGQVYWMPKAIARKFLPLVARRPEDTAGNSGMPLEQLSIKLEELLQPDQGLAAELLPGKSADEAAHLVHQASLIALIASTTGVTHLHAHFASNTTAVAALASRLSGIPFSFTAHARDIYHRYIDRVTDEQLLCRKIAEARFCITVSEYNKEHLQALLVKHGYREQENVIRLYNGIDLERFRSPAPCASGSQILAVGRLVEKKGFRYLIEACATLLGKGMRFRCDIIGDGPEKEALESLVIRRGLSDRIQLKGSLPQEQLREKLEQSTMVVLPCVIAESGDRDGLPTVLLEAMAMSRACVSTSVAGIPEIIEHGKTGLLVPQQDARSLANAIQQLLEQPEQAWEMGRCARERAEEHFSLRNNVSALLELVSTTTTRAKASASKL